MARKQKIKVAGAGGTKNVNAKFHSDGSMTIKKKDLKKASGKRPGLARAVTTSTLAGGLVPGVAGVQAARIAANSGAGRKTTMAAGAAGLAGSLVPGVGAGVGAMRGMDRAGAFEHNNKRNAKTGVRSSKPTAVRSQGRVKKRG